MANNSPVPDFVRGQALLARDFAALVGAVRDLLHGQMPVQEQRRGGRYYRPFVLAGRCVPHQDKEGKPVAGVAEVLVQVGEHVVLLEDDRVEGLQEAMAKARAKKVPCGLHAAIEWERVDVGKGWRLRAKSMECTAAAWVPPEEQPDGSFANEGEHGGTVFSVIMPEENVRGQLQCTPVPWVVPQHPAMIWRGGNGDSDAELLTGEMCLLPAPAGEEQLLTWCFGGYYQPDYTFKGVSHEWRGRLDKDGVLHLSARNYDLKQ